MRVFISYRREDTGWPASRIHDFLSARFGESNVFMDIVAISPGEDFVARIQEAISKSQAAIIVIGKQWLGIKENNVNRRLDDPKDFVRLEVELALQQGKYIIPVLIDDAKMPSDLELPDTIKALSRRNAMKVRTENFRSEISILVNTLEKTANITSLGVVAGAWKDFLTGSTTYFRQNGDRIVGYYDFGTQEPVGMYWGKIDSAICELDFRWLNDRFKGKAIVKLVNKPYIMVAVQQTAKMLLRRRPNLEAFAKTARLPDGKFARGNTIYGYWRIGGLDSPTQTVPIVCKYVSDEMPPWLNDSYFQDYDKLFENY